MERLYDNFYRHPSLMEEERRICSNEALLKRDLTKWQKKILLRIIDDKNLICEKTSLDSFEKGFCLGVKLTTEIYEFNGVLSDEHLDRTPCCRERPKFCVNGQMQCK